MTRVTLLRLSPDLPALLGLNEGYNHPFRGHHVQPASLKDPLSQQHVSSVVSYTDSGAAAPFNRSSPSTQLPKFKDVIEGLLSVGPSSIRTAAFQTRTTLGCFFGPSHEISA